MKILWMPGPQGRLFLGATAATVAVGPGKYKDRGVERLIAAVEVHYRLPEFLPVAFLLKTMRDQNISPEVYLWDESADEPEVAVYFSIKSPSRTMLEELLARWPVASLMLDSMTESEYPEVFATGEANVPREGVQKFFTEFKRLGVAVVIVREEGTSGPFGDADAFLFPVTVVHRRAPEAIFAL